ncbi:MAG: hypothetical protein OJF49_004592 [Ktedonobacterales bacterium]|jgi:hypothetical protein|nr:MAG: hypothetical protein OJF49_004592 [Ktedonobacterales bacterium]
MGIGSMSEQQTATSRQSEPPSLPIGARRLTALDRAFLGLLLLMVAGHLMAARLAVGWWSAAALDGVAAIYLLAMSARREWRVLLARLFLLGLVAGVLELATDAAGERFAHSLVYPAGEPSLWVSPVYMPFSWAIVLTQLGYLGWRLRGLVPPLRLWVAMALTGVVGMLMVPFYEEMAYYAGWWHYASVWRIGHTPLYVLLFEGAIAAILPVLLSPRLTQRPLRFAALLGAIVGVWMPVAALLSWLAIGH